MSFATERCLSFLGKDFALWHASLYVHVFIVPNLGTVDDFPLSCRYCPRDGLIPVASRVAIWGRHIVLIRRHPWLAVLFGSMFSFLVWKDSYCPLQTVQDTGFFLWVKCDTRRASFFSVWFTFVASSMKAKAEMKHVGKVFSYPYRSWIARRRKYGGPHSSVWSGACAMFRALCSAKRK